MDVEGALFISNTAENGGAIYNDSGDLSIDDSSFANNTTTGNGGAINNNWSNKVDIKNTSFDDNIANGIYSHGGALYNYYGTVGIENSTFDGNSASYGGAISNYGILNITDTSALINDALIEIKGNITKDAVADISVIAEKMPELDMISIGPDMKDIHTPMEALNLPSTIRVYQFIEKLLLGARVDLIGKNTMLLRAQRGIRFCANGYHCVRAGRYTYYADAMGRVISRREFMENKSN